MMQARTWLAITPGAAAAILSREAPGLVPTPRDRGGTTSFSSWRTTTAMTPRASWDTPISRPPTSTG